MSRRLAQLCVLGVALGVAARARSDAPPDQYAVFGPTDKTVRDLHTHLEWWRDSSSMLPLAAAQATCTALGGYRVPTLRELLTLVDEVPHRVYQGGTEVNRYIDRNAFPDTFTTQAYWTSTQRSGETWTVSFANGGTRLAMPTDLRALRCVRTF